LVMQITNITGSTYFKSKLDIQNVGKIIGQKILGGLAFGNLDGFFEEVPGILIENEILGFQISIQETVPSDVHFYTEYVLSITPLHTAIELTPAKIDDYLDSLFEKVFSGSSEIIPVHNCREQASY